MFQENFTQDEVKRQIFHLSLAQKRKLLTFIRFLTEIEHTLPQLEDSPQKELTAVE